MEIEGKGSKNERVVLTTAHRGSEVKVTIPKEDAIEISMFLHHVPISEWEEVYWYYQATEGVKSLF